MVFGFSNHWLTQKYTLFKKLCWSKYIIFKIKFLDFILLALSRRAMLPNQKGHLRQKSNQTTLDATYLSLKYRKNPTATNLNIASNTKIAVKK